MKERIVIDEDFYVKHFQEREIEFQEEDMCSGGNPEEWWHYKKEQVPENWGDFLELCKTLKKVFISDNECYVEFNKLRFYMDGTVEFNGVIIKIVVGVSRMWQIIKNLLGEK